MANNRMWLRCTVCGGQVLLAKHWGSGHWEAHTGTHILRDGKWEPLKKSDHNEFFASHVHGPTETHFEIEFEVGGRSQEDE